MPARSSPSSKPTTSHRSLAQSTLARILPPRRCICDLVTSAEIKTTSVKPRLLHNPCCIFAPHRRCSLQHTFRAPNPAMVLALLGFDLMQTDTLDIVNAARSPFSFTTCRLGYFCDILPPRLLLPLLTTIFATFVSHTDPSRPSDRFGSVDSFARSRYPGIPASFYLLSLRNRPCWSPFVDIDGPSSSLEFDQIAWTKWTNHGICDSSQWKCDQFRRPFFPLPYLFLLSPDTLPFLPSTSAQCLAIDMVWC